MLCPLCSNENSDRAAFCDICTTPLGEVPIEGRHLLSFSTRLAGDRFAIGVSVGWDGSCITYLAADRQERQPAALKELFPEGSARPGKRVNPPGTMSPEEFEKLVDLFVQESEVLRQVNHPNLVRVIDCFRENQTAYQVTRYYPSPSLALILERGRLEESLAVAYAEQVGEALDALHDRGLLHRAVNPSNVLIPAEGCAVLSGFAIAWSFGGIMRKSPASAPACVPMELFSERVSSGPFSDVYSLAATLYWSLAGEMPPATTDRSIGVEVRPLREFNPNISQAVADAVTLGMTMEPARRPATVRDFLALLRGTQVAAPPRPLVVPAPAAPAEPAAPQDSNLPASTPTLRLRGHEALIHSVAVSNTGRAIASAGWDGTVRLWAGGALAWTQRLEALVFGVAFDPQERLVAAACADGQLRLWDMRSQQLLMSMEHPAEVMSVAFSADARYATTGASDAAVRVFDVQSGRMMLCLAEHQDRVWSVAFSPDGALLASASEDCTVRLWEPSSGLQLYQLKPATSRTRSISFSSDGLLLAAAVDGRAEIWETFSGKSVRQFEHGTGVNSVVFSPDARYVATAADDGVVRLWDAASGLLKGSLEASEDRAMSVAWSRDGRTIVSGGGDQTVRAWSTAPVVSTPVRPAPPFPPPPAPARPAVAAVAPAPEPAPAAAPAVSRVPSAPLVTDPATRVFLGHVAPVRTIAFSPDGQFLVTGSEDQTVRVWSVVDGTEVQRFSDHEGTVYSVSTAGGYVASGSDDGRLRIWQLATGEPLVNVKIPGPIRSVFVSEGGNYVAAGCADFLVYVWDLQNRKLRHKLDVHEATPTSVSMSPDGQWILSAAEDRLICLWSNGSGQCVKRIKDHPSTVWWVTFAPDGKQFFSASSDRTVRGWDTKTGASLLRYSGHKAPVRAVVAPAGVPWLVTGGDDRAIRFFDMATAKETKVDLPHGVGSLAASRTDVAWTTFDVKVRLAPVAPFVAALAAAATPT